MIKETTTTKEVTETTVTCDECKQNIRVAGMEGDWFHYRCIVCEHDLCHSCVVTDPRDKTGMPTRFCKPCWEFGQPYRDQQVEIQVKSATRNVAIEEEWYAAARKAMADD